MSRFLVVAAVGAPSSLRTDGSTVLLLTVATELADAGHFVYMVFPEGVNMAELPEHERIMYFNCGVSPQVLDSQMWTVDQPYIWQMFSLAEGKYVVDAAICLHAQQVIPLRQALGAVQSQTIPVFVIEQGVSWLTTAPGYRTDLPQEQWAALGASYANMVVVSEFDRLNWEAKARAFDLSAVQLTRMSKNMLVASAPIDVKLLQSIAETAGPRYSTPTCLWAARTNATKNPEVVLDIYDSLYKQGENLQIKYLTQTSDLMVGVFGSRLGLFDERQYMEVKTGANRQDFYSQASRSHVFVCWSHSESYNSSAVEASLLGCVFLCVDKPQFRQLYPDGLGDSRFWLKSREDAMEVVRWVLQNYDQAYALQKPLRDRFIAQQTDHRISRVIPERLNKLLSLVESPSEYSLPLHTGLGALVSQVVDNMPEEFSLKDLLAVMSKAGTNFKTDNQRRYVTRKIPTDWMIHKAILHGKPVIDTCERRYPTYRKHKDDAPTD